MEFVPPMASTLEHDSLRPRRAPLKLDKREAKLAFDGTSNVQRPACGVERRDGEVAAHEVQLCWQIARGEGRKRSRSDLGLGRQKRGSRNFSILIFLTKNVGFISDHSTR